MGAVMYRVRSSLRASRGAVVVLVLVVAVIGGLSLTILAGAARTRSAPDRYGSWRGHVYDVSIQQDTTPPRMAEVERLPAVTRLDAASFVFGTVSRAGGGDPIDALVFAGSPAALNAHVAEGRLPERDDEALATRSAASLAGVHLGDRLALQTITQAQADESGFDAPRPAGPAVTATLVGLLDGPSELQDGYPLVLFPRALLDEGDVGVAATLAVAALAPGADVGDLRAQLDALPDGDEFGLTPAEWVSGEVRDAVNTQALGIVVLGIIVTVASLVVLGQLLSRQLRLTDTERTVLHAVGFRRAQVVADPAVRAAVVVVAGAVGAAVVAYVASDRFPVSFVDHVEPHPGRRFDPLVHGLGPVALALVLLGWVVVTSAGGHRDPHADRPPSIIDRLAPMVPSARVSTALRFTLASGPGPARSTITSVLGLILIVGVVLGSMIFGDSLARLVDQPARYGANFDFGLGTGGDEIGADVLAVLEADPDVAAITAYGTVTVGVGTDSLDITGMRHVAGDLAPEVLDGQLPTRPDEIALGRVAERDLDVGIGDELEVSGATGRKRLHVTGTVLLPAVSQADGVGQGGLMTLVGLQQIDREALLDSAVVDLRAGADADAVRARIAEVTGMTPGPFDDPPTIVNLRRVRAIPFLVGAVAAALALLSLAHQLLVGGRRRQRDFEVLRALGADRRWRSAVVHWQATILVAIVLAIALPAAIGISSNVYAPFADRIGARTDASFPILQLVAAMAAVLVLANVVASVPARGARRQRATRALTDRSLP